MKSEASSFLKRQLGTVVVALAAAFAPAAWGDIHLDMLKTRTDNFTNVTVYGRSKTDLFIRHARGIGNVKLDSLAPETLAELNSASLNGSTKSVAAGDTSVASGFETSEASAQAKASAYLANVNGQMRERLAGLSALKTVQPPGMAVVAAILGAFLLLYLFTCYCFKLICIKTGNDPGFMIWLPILQTFPLLRAANMSGWCFLGLCIPVVNLIIQIVWCFKITQARGKSAWVAIGLLLPLTNVISLLYLAFADSSDSESPRTEKVTVTGAPLPVEA